MKKLIKVILYPIYKIYKSIYFEYGKSHPKWLADKMYKKNFGRSINWMHPSEMNEKIRWMQFNTDTTEWTLLADKYRVREYLKHKGYEEILVPILGVWEDARDIDFSKLPDCFVIKTNHGSGDVFIIKDKTKIELEDIRKKIQYYLKQPFGYEAAETHYLSIKPCILAEEMLAEDNPLSSSMVDYKFYCIKGEPYCCAVFYDRDPVTHHTNSTFYDMAWKRHDEWRAPHITSEPKDIPRPLNLDRMIQACHDLAGHLPFVRLDFYETNGKLYFGEFTFTPAALTGGSMNKNLCKKIGKEISLPSGNRN